VRSYAHTVLPLLQISDDALDRLLHILCPAYRVSTQEINHSRAGCVEGTHPLIADHDVPSLF
jgi:hypothetical protein